MNADGHWAHYSEDGDQRAKFLMQCRDELRERLKDYKFSHFITLATNHRPFSDDMMRELLREWDARVNREMNGPKWTKRPDERLLWFAFIEKSEVNPHWHLIAQVDPVIESEARRRRTESMPAIAEKHWRRLVPSGTFDCQPVVSDGVIAYVTKVVGKDKNFERFVVYREIMNL